MPFKVIDGKPKFFVETVVKQDEKWREQTHKEFYEMYGHWYWFTGYAKRQLKNWIEQYDRSNNEQK